MANYTIELRQIVESGHNIFDFDYDFFDEKKRRAFEESFIRHFYFREIGCETVDRFKWHLRDKMMTVFPYYNELLKTTLIEYSVLDNYNITENTTVKRENTGKSSGISSTVGQIFDNQETNVNISESGSETSETSRNGTSEVTRNGVSNSETSETVNNSGNSESTENVTSNGEEIERFLDTPQGAVDLTDSKYLTTLKQNNATNEAGKTVSEEHEDETTKTGSGETTETVTTDSTTNESGRGVSSTDGERTETHSSQTEQKSTADNNTRLYTEGEQTETVVYTRRGNIGVDSDADLIQKHIKLQQLLQKIQLMFFDECEDLFMLVY